VTVQVPIISVAEDVPLAHRMHTRWQDWPENAGLKVNATVSVRRLPEPETDDLLASKIHWLFWRVLALEFALIPQCFVQCRCTDNIRIVAEIDTYMSHAGSYKL